MRFSLERASPDDAAELAMLHAAVAEDLTKRFARGSWSASASEKALLWHMRISSVLVARSGSEIVGTLRLQTKKPWAIDKSYFSACKKPLYLTDMAVLPSWQRRGLGRRCLEEAVRLTKAWPADAIRLDAYDADAGAGAFYRKCGFTEVGRVTYRSSPLIYFELLVAR